MALDQLFLKETPRAWDELMKAPFVWVSTLVSILYSKKFCQRAAVILP